MITIKNIYAGKPDAKDEVEVEGINSFLQNYVMPDNFNIISLIEGTGYFITGYKGTGKTALLYYLDNYIRKKDAITCSSFAFSIILFFSINAVIPIVANISNTIIVITRAINVIPLLALLNFSSF